MKNDANYASEVTGSDGRSRKIPPYSGVRMSADIQPVLVTSMIPVQISWAHGGSCSHRN
jgi:hypothetical protein